MGRGRSLGGPQTARRPSAGPMRDRRARRLLARDARERAALAEQLSAEPDLFEACAQASSQPTGAELDAWLREGLGIPEEE